MNISLVGCEQRKSVGTSIVVVRYRKISTVPLDSEVFAQFSKGWFIPSFRMMGGRNNVSDEVGKAAPRTAPPVARLGICVVVELTMPRHATRRGDGPKT